VTDEADLLRGVFATPDDDLPRLVKMPDLLGF
jgi:uncharacterized protein (TIGR02996 family)